MFDCVIVVGRQHGLVAARSLILLSSISARENQIGRWLLVINTKLIRTLLRRRGLSEWVVLPYWH